MTTFLMEPWEFRIPVGNSYLCKDAGTKAFHTVFRWQIYPRQTHIIISLFSGNQMILKETQGFCCLMQWLHSKRCPARKSAQFGTFTANLTFSDLNFLS